MNKGTLFGVGVGPGDPELMTLKAVRTIERCPCIATPETAGEKTLALTIAAGAVDLTGKEILPLRFLMTRDKEAQARCHEALADQIAARLDGGTDVAMLNLGDVSIYSTFAYLMDILTQRGYAVVMIPGVPSFCAVAAALGTGLTTMNEPLHILPASGMELSEALALKGSKVLMKTGKSMPEVRRVLTEKGLADKTMLVQNCGLPNERICRDLSEAQDDISYFTTMIIRG
ncbi:MAG: precorrin-2 C(20)-methyltransferase [Clostridia bacterium]|nr:precorrin-2 C(20)-methyltransferase [Clostridia bacterium]